MQPKLREEARELERISWDLDAGRKALGRVKDHLLLASPSQQARCRENTCFWLVDANMLSIPRKKNLLQDA